jgi:hypothetical protein
MLNQTDRICCNCKVAKPISEYYTKGTSRHQAECKQCVSIRKTTWNKSDAGRLSSLKTRLKQRFGLTLEEYNEMFKKQGGRCAICKTDKCSSGHNLSVDHCHKTGNIRGLLCKPCNLVLGNSGDNIKILISAANYLTETKHYGRTPR